MEECVSIQVNANASWNFTENYAKMYHKDQGMIKCCSKKVVWKNHAKMVEPVMNLRENVFALPVTEDEGVIEYEVVDVSNISKKYS